MATPIDPSTPACLEAALFYASLGWAVFPLHAPVDGVCSCGVADCSNVGKHPLTQHGLKDASTDAAAIRAWWDRWPFANVGVATGAKSGLAVIDLDADKGGLESFAELVAYYAKEHGPPPSTPSSRTGGGGEHLLFTAAPGLTNSRSRVGKGIDVRANGGYIVAPPSVHASGRAYAWGPGLAPGDVSLAELPTWLLELAERRPALVAVRSATTSHPLTERIKRASAYLRTMPPAISGQGGHDATWRAALALVRGFDLPAAVALELLASEHNPRCVPLWSEKELRHKVDGAERDAELAPGYLLDDPRRQWKAPSQPAYMAPEQDRAAVESLPETSAAREMGDDSDEVVDLAASPPGAPPPPPRDQNWQQGLLRSKDGGVKNTYGNVCLILRHTYGDRLTYDEMRLTPMLDGIALRDADIGRVREELERVWQISPSKDNTAEGLRQISIERSFHPVRQYLSALKWSGSFLIDRVAREVLRIDDPTPLDLRMIKSWFVSAVARAMTPGCKVDTALVLVGEQNLLKSTFFSVLGGEFFSDTAMDISNKDGLLQLAFAWIYEWPEIENVTSRKQASEVKAFATSRVDTFRPPFARAVVQHPRSAVIVGTTNQDQFLNDPTGSRRFWVLSISKRIEKALLAKWRDDLWSEAVALFQSGYQWWLEADEEKAREEANSKFHVGDPWEVAITSWLDGGIRNPAVLLTSALLMSSALKLEVKDQTPYLGQRVAGVMRRLGYTNRKVRLGTDRSARVWVRHDASSMELLVSE